jgi:hypothetical protein
MTHSASGTPPKIALLSTCLGASVGWAAHQGASAYSHLDANGGSGGHTGDYVLNRVAIRSICGTPDLIFRKADDPRWQHMAFHVTIVERNRQSLEHLRRYLGGAFPHVMQSPFGQERVSWRLIRGDNARVLETYAETVAHPATAFGSILLDPTGCSPRSGGAVPIAVLARVARQLPRFMLLMQFPHGFNRRVWGYNANHADRLLATQHLADYWPLRPYWLISEPFGRQRAHLVVCGSDHPLREWHCGDLHLYDTTSTRGRELARTCDEIDPRRRRRRRRATADAPEVGAP